VEVKFVRQAGFRAVFTTSSTASRASDPTSGFGC
jgi:hypothetical protein